MKTCERCAELEAKIEEWELGYSLLERDYMRSLDGNRQLAEQLSARVISGVEQRTMITIHRSLIRSMNKKGSWKVQHESIRTLRHIGKLQLARQLKPVKARTLASFLFQFEHNGGVPDSGNLAATTKPLIDGMTDGGIWPDDNNDWVIGPDHRIGEPTGKRDQVLVTVTLTEMEGR